MAKFGDIRIKYETRGCEVDGRPGYFHCWEHWANVVGESALRGGHAAGQVGQVYGIVEFSDGVKRVDPAHVKFTDEENSYLGCLEKYLKSNIRVCDNCKFQHTDNCPNSKLCYDTEFKPYFVKSKE